jgi:hypothetical protein
VLGPTPELCKNVEVVQRQPVRLEQLGIELACNGGVRPQEADPRLKVGASSCGS